MQPDCTKRPGPLRRALAVLALALCVLAGQSGVATHELGHALDRLAASASAGRLAGTDVDARSGDCVPDEGDRVDCPLHALFTELASIAVGSWPALLAEAPSLSSAVSPGAPAFTVARVAFRSRAPPVFPA
jgi:hypothetical protein